jgi:hypothetical protein
LASVWSVGSRWLSPRLPLTIWQSINIYKLYIQGKLNLNYCIQIT